MSEKTMAKQRTKKSQSLIVPIIVIAMLAVGVALAWRFWFSGQQDDTAAPSAATAEEVLIDQVAAEYWQSGDAVRAQEQLAGLDANSLAQLIAKMEADAPDETTRQHLIVLRTALNLPSIEPSLLDTLLEQKMILVSLVASGALLLGAITLSVLPAIQQASAQAAQQRREAAILTAREQQADRAAEIEEQQDIAASGGARAEDGGEAQTAQARAAKKPKLDAQPQVAAQPAAEPAVPSAIQDILSSVFVDEDSLARYEVLLKELEDISAAELLIRCNDVESRLQALTSTLPAQDM